MENMKRTGRSLTAFLLSILMVFSVFNMIHVNAASPALTVTTSVDSTSPYTGDNFTYTIRYANPSTTLDASNVTITDVLPANIKYVSYTSSTDIASVSTTNNGTNDVVTFIFKSVLPAGRTGLVKITAKFPEGTTLATVNGQPNTATNFATIADNQGYSANSNSVTVTPVLKSADWSITKTRVLPSPALPVLDQQVKYSIRVNANSKIGGLNLKNVVVTDTIPTGAVFVSATNNGVYNGTTVTWNISSLAVGASQTFYVVLKYPSASFTKSTTVTNNASASGTLLDDVAAPTVTSSASHAFTDPIFSIDSPYKNGRQSNDRYSVGQTAQFFIGNIKSSSNIAIDSYEVVDAIPSDITLGTISTGSYNQSVSEAIYYKTTGNSNWRAWTGSPISNPSNSTLNVSSLSLSGGEKVTAVKWVVTGGTDGLLVGFANTSELKVTGVVAMPSVGNKITNTVTITAAQGTNSPIVKTASKDIYVIDPMPWLQPTKSVVGGQVAFNYGDTVQFNLRIKNNDLATGSYVNPIAVDTLPPEFENYQFVSFSKGNSSITGSPVIDSSSTKNISGIDYKILKFSFTGTLNPGEYVDVVYSVKIKDLTSVGYITNSLYVSSDSQSVYENDASGLITDSNDLDSDGSTDDQFVRSDVKVFVKFQGSLGSEFSNRGELEPDWSVTKYPEYVETVAGGMADYKLKVVNDGSNGPIKNIIMINKLPHIGDTGVVDTSGRGSQWSPYLVNKITGENGAALPAGTTVYYTTVDNPSCVELSDTVNNKAGQAGDKWTTTPPADITTVTAIKIDFGPLVLQKNESVVVEWPLRAPLGSPTNLVAWDSFGYGATYTDVDASGTSTVEQSFLPSEPKKVGFKIHEPVPANLGSYVWDDANKNGIQDEGEAGINGILVNLYQKDGNDFTLVNYTRTGYSYDGDSGFFQFPDQGSGIYKFEFVYPKTNTDDNGYTSSYRLSPKFAGDDTSLDSNAEPSTLKDVTIESTTFNSVMTDEVIINDDNFTIDCGLYKTASVGDKVWYDKNANGIQDSGEAGLSGVTVTLLDADGNTAKYGNGTTVASQTTTSNGAYYFTGLEPGAYMVKFTIPTGYQYSGTGSGTITTDSDGVSVNDTTITTDLIYLVSGQNNLSVDQGYYLGHIGNQIFEDTNANGVKDAGENGVSGVTVKLYKNGSSTALLTTTTNSSGIYSFDDLLPASYVVTITKPAAYHKFSPQTVGSTTKLTDNDSDVNITTGSTASFTIGIGERIDTIDAGMYKFASIGDLVWHDLNGNGVRDTGEFGIAGITVHLTDTAGNPVNSGYGYPVDDAVTDANGTYHFYNLNPGNYLVHFINPNQLYMLSPTKAGGTTSTDSDGTFVTNKDAEAVTAAVTLTSGLNVTNIDQGMYLASIGDKVWNDLNGNGIQDSGEAGIAGVTVKLLDATTLLPVNNAFGNEVANATTDSSGIYQFVNLPAGSYVVEFTKPTGYSKAADKNMGSDTAKDSNISLSTFRTDTIVLAQGQRNLTVDAGFYIVASVGDFVYTDLNGSGTQDAGEPGIAGATVRLYLSNGTTQASDADGVLVANKTTDANGKYSFTNLKPGTYIVKVDKPTGYDNAIDRAKGTDRTIDSDIDTTTFKTAAIALKSGENNTSSADAGFYKFGTIGDFVWNDKNGNGIQNYGEPGVANVTVNLYTSTDIFVKSTTTNASGAFTFTALKPATYKINVVLPTGYDRPTDKNRGTDTAIDSDVDLYTLTSNSIALQSAQVITSTDIGLFVMTNTNGVLSIFTNSKPTDITYISTTVYQYAPCYFLVKTIPDATKIRIWVGTSFTAEIPESAIVDTIIGSDGMKYWTVNYPMSLPGVKTVTYDVYAFGRWSMASIYSVNVTVLKPAVYDVKTGYMQTDIRYNTSTILEGTNAYYSVKTDSTVTQLKYIIDGVESLVPAGDIITITDNGDGTKQWIIKRNYTTIGSYDVRFMGYKDDQWVNQTFGVTTNVVKPVISIKYGSTIDDATHTDFTWPQNTEMYVRVKTASMVDSLILLEDGFWYERVTEDQIYSVIQNGDGTKDWIIKRPFYRAEDSKTLQFIAGYNGITSPASNISTHLAITNETIQNYKVSDNSTTFANTAANIYVSNKAYFSLRTYSAVSSIKVVANGVSETLSGANIIKVVDNGDGTKDWMVCKTFATAGNYSVKIYGYMNSIWQPDYKTVSVTVHDYIESVLIGSSIDSISQTSYTANLNVTNYVKIRTINSVTNLMMKIGTYYEVVPAESIISITDNGNGTKDWIISRAFTSVGNKTVEYSPMFNSSWRTASNYKLSVNVISSAVTAVLTGNYFNTCTETSSSNYRNYVNYFRVTTSPNVTSLSVVINGSARAVTASEILSSSVKPSGMKEWVLKIKLSQLGDNTVGFKGYIGAQLVDQVVNVTVTVLETVYSVKGGTSVETMDSTSFEATIADGAYIQVVTDANATGLMTVIDGSYFEVVSSDMILSTTTNELGQKVWTVKRPFTKAGLKSISYEAMINNTWSTPSQSITVSIS